MTDELQQAIFGARRLASRIAESLRTLAPLRPIDAARIDALTEAEAERTDAFLKRYENLTLLQEQLWWAVLRADADDPTSMSRRDVIERMDRLGLVPSAAAALDAVRIRNRLAHVYPTQPDRSAAQLEAALDAAPFLLDCVARAETYLAERGAP